MSVAESVAALREKFSDQILSESDFRDEKTVVIAREAIHAVCLFCRDTLKFDYLVDISSVDNMGGDPRFEMVYALYSYETHQHLRLKAAVPEDARQVDSVVDIWATANWHEREVFDMMGIEFPKHPDLRRILMWEGFPFFPLRKDFPLAGKPSEMPEVAFSDRAPLAGGPFVTVPDATGTVAREPRSRDFK